MLTKKEQKYFTFSLFVDDIEVCEFNSLDQALDYAKRHNIKEYRVIVIGEFDK